MKARILLVSLIIFSIILGLIGLFSYSEHLFNRFLDGEIDLEIQEIYFEAQGKYFKITAKESVDYFKNCLKNSSDSRVENIYRYYECYIKINIFWTKRLEISLHKNKRYLTIDNNDIFYGVVFDGDIPEQIKNLVDFLSS